MKIIFFGTDNFALQVLNFLAKHHEIIAVVTAPDGKVGRKQTLQESPVAVLARDLSLKILKPDFLKNDLVLEEILRALSADLFAVVVYGKIIPQNILSIPLKGVMNVHPSLLPLYRGPSPIRTPLLNGDVKTGVSIMLIDEEVDHGPILAQEELPLEPDDNNISVTEKLAQIAAPLLHRAIDGYEKGTLQAKEQDHARATYTKIITKADGKIDWNKSAADIYNMFRAFYDWPQIWTEWQGLMLKIIDCVPAAVSTDTSPGTVLEGGNVACGSGTVLQINQLQLQGKNETDIKSFLNGYRKFVGSKLG